MSRLERWSRLKRNAVRDENAAHEEGSPQLSAPVEETPAELNATNINAEQSQAVSDEPEAPPEPGSLDHTLPDPETLEAGSDFSAFMVPGVSGALRRQALKRLWATGNYNVRDGLDDYDADYRQQLKPMTSGLASKLRRWTHKVEEAVDKPLDDQQAEPETHSGQTPPQDEPTQTPDDSTSPLSAEKVREDAGEEAFGSGASADSAIKNAPLDDQSDYLSGTHTKR
ncbi:MAG: DUF3306 domain-containing protein [Halomonas sp.]|nr:DUF3306 domain-containing protein [Halomonas sp.]TVP47739.1 MAG: DUF3306 domain-containing protein [Halomonas sp.]